MNAKKSGRDGKPGPDFKTTDKRPHDTPAPRAKQTRPPPAFQFYASDWLADSKFVHATLAERGLLISMLSYVWVNDRIENDPALLPRSLGMDAGEGASLGCALIQKHFSPCPDDPSFLQCPELLRQRFAMEDRRIKQADGGKETQRIARELKAAKQAAKLAAEVAAKQPDKLPASFVEGSEMKSKERKGVVTSEKEAPTRKLQSTVLPEGAAAPSKPRSPLSTDQYAAQYLRQRQGE